MSTSPPPPAAHPTAKKDPNEITIVSHSNLFYWWPVWAVGFLLGILSLMSGYVMAIVPNDSRAMQKVEFRDEGKDGHGEGIVVLKGDLPRDREGKIEQPHLGVAKDKNYGVLFLIVMILVILITNVPLRGMWSVVVIITIILLSIIFALAGIWETIFDWFRVLDIRINAGGYFLIATALFAIWLVTILLFDRQVYITFTPKQLRVCTEIGGGEKVYDTVGMHMEKQRSDIFRHWILGLGSGDLIVKTSGSTAHQFDLHNVLFVGRKVRDIEEMMQKQFVIETK